MDSDVMTGVQALWKDEVLVNYTIHVGNEQFKVHKVIMASVSDYFKAMLTGGMVESQTDSVKIEGLNPRAVSNIIEYIYTGSFGFLRARMDEILGCAVYFQISAAIEKSSELLYYEINEHNCFDILAIFKAFSLDHGMEHALNYIDSNIDGILETCDPNEMSFEAFVNLMDFWGKPEWDIFDCANMWISVDYENRIDHLNDLMGHIRFALMTPAELLAVEETYIYCNSDGAWHGLVQEAMKYHTFPTPLKIFKHTEQSTVRGDPSPVCFVADSYSSPGFYTTTEDEAWMYQTSLTTPDFQDGVAAALEVNNYLIVCNAFCRDQKWCIFNPCTKEWSPMAVMRRPREDFGLVYHEKHLYALGGRFWTKSQMKRYPLTDTIERYNFETNRWGAVYCAMPLPVHKHYACSLNGSIYVTGGWYHTPSGAASTQLDAFNTTNETWVSKAPLTIPESRCKVQVMRLLKEEGILVVGEGFRMQFYSPSTDQWCEWHWKRYIDTDIMWDDGCTILAKGKHIYFFNIVHDMLDEYDWLWTSRYTQKLGQCAKWLVEEKGCKVTEYELNSFPIMPGSQTDPVRKFFCALLSFIPAIAVKRD